MRDVHDPSMNLRSPAAPSEPVAAAIPNDMPGREYLALPKRVRTDAGPVFDSIELAPVALIDSEGTCEAFESLEDIPEEFRTSVFWSIYGHTPGEGVQCIGDFKTRENALEVLRRLFGDLRMLRASADGALALIRLGLKSIRA